MSSHTLSFLIVKYNSEILIQNLALLYTRCTKKLRTLLKLRIETLEACSIHHNKQKAFNNHGSKTVNFRDV